MKFQSFRVAVLTASILVSPMLSFAGSQPKLRPEPTQSEKQDRTGITRAVQQGKGTGMTRNDVYLNANANRLQTPEDSQGLRDQSGLAHPNWTDAAFRK
jgi:hypothetical protein